MHFWRPALFLRHIIVFVRFGKSLAGTGKPAQHASAKRKGERVPFFFLKKRFENRKYRKSRSLSFPYQYSGWNAYSANNNIRTDHLTT